MLLETARWSPPDQGWLALTGELLVHAGVGSIARPGWHLDRTEEIETLFGPAQYRIYRRLPAGGPKTPSLSCSVM